MKKSIIALLNLSLVLNSTLSFASTPKTINLSGRLFNQDGSAPVTDTVDFIIGVYDPSGQCELYEEMQSGINLSPTLGNFSLMVGSPIGDSKRTINDLGKDVTTVFNNLSTNTYLINAKTCLAGYTPASGDGRKIRITVVNKGVSETLSPDEIITSVPFALSSDNIQGLAPDQLIQVQNKVTQSNLDSLTNNSDSSSLHNHDSSYVKLGSQPSFSGVTITGTPNSLTDATNKSYIDSAITAVNTKITTVSDANTALSSKLSNLTTDQIAEGSTNVYFTKSRSQSSISVDSSSPLSYSSGVLGLPESTSSSNGYLSKAGWATFNGKQNSLGFTPLNKAGDTVTGALTISNVLSMSSNSITNVLDPINKQDAATKNYVDTQTTALSNSNTSLSSQVSTLSTKEDATQSALTNLKTDSVAEGNSLYYTDARARLAISTDSTTPLTYATGVVGINKASSTSDGYVTSTQFTSFNEKQASLGYTPVNKAGDTITGALNINSSSVSAPTSSVKAMAAQTSDLLDFLDSTGNILTHVDALGHVIIPATQSTDLLTAAVTKGYVDNKLSAIVAGVSSVNGATGTVVLTSDNISQGTANKYYTTSQAQTDAKAAISAALPLSYSNGQVSLPLSQGAMLIGNGAGVATAVSLTGDGTISSAGAFSLKNTGTAGSYSKVNTDAQGRVSSGGTLAQIDIPNPTGDVQGTFSTTTVKGLQGVPLDSSTAAPTNNSILAYSSSALKWTLNTVSGLLGFTPVSNSLPQGQVLVGNTSGVATGVTVSGDLALTSTGSASVKKLQGTPLASATPTAGQVLGFDGTNWMPSALPASAVTSVNSQAGAVVLNSDNISQGVTNKYYTTSQAQIDAKSAISTAAPLNYNNGIISLPLSSGNLLVGSSLGVASSVSMSGDGTISSTGAFNLKATGTTGTYAKVTTDAQGRVSSGGTLAQIDIPNPTGDVQGTFITTTVKGIQGVSIDSTASAPSNNNILAYSSTALKWTLNTVSGLLGFTPVSNSLPQGQVLVGNTSGMVTGVSVSGDVSLTSTGATTVKKLQGTPLASATPTAGQVLSFDGTNWTPSALPASAVTSVNGSSGSVVLNSDNISQGATNKYYTTSQAQTDAKLAISAATPLSYSSGVMSLPLSSGNLLVGNTSGVASSVTMSGDGTISSTGAFGLKNTGTAGTYSKVTTDAQGRVSTGGSLVASDIPNPTGDVQGTFNTTTVKGIQGVPVDSTAAAPSNNNILAYNSTTLKWALNTVAGLLGYTPVNKAGDTMTGKLVAPSIQITGGASAGQTLISDAAGNGTWQSSSAGNPSGTVISFAGVNCPTGYLKADGTLYPVSTYPTLATVLWDATNNVYAYGGGASGTNFNVPDLRGRFMRGADGAAANDPDHSSRTVTNTGGNSGNNVGSLESDMFASHGHGVYDPGHSHTFQTNNDDFNSSGGNPPSFAGDTGTNKYTWGTSTSTTGISIYASGGNETRPKNVYINYCIKL